MTKWLWGLRFERVQIVSGGRYVDFLEKVEKGTLEDSSLLKPGQAYFSVEGKMKSG